MTRQLAKDRVGVATDVHPALIATYQAARSGWQPPTSVSEAEYAAAKLLPDSDPRKGFVGFFCSFGGKYFRGRARWRNRNFAEEASRTLSAVIRATRHWEFECASFFDCEPHACLEFLYCDPPYADVTGFSVPFQYDLFWERCQQWAQYVPVYVSEFACPVKHRRLLTIARGKGVSGYRQPCEDLLVRVEI